MSHCEYIKIQNASDRSPVSKIMDVAALHPYDGMRVVLEQLIYVRYISLVSNSELIQKELLTKIKSMYTILPSSIHMNNTSLNSLYDSMRSVVQFMLEKQHLIGPPISIHDLFAIFRVECQSPNVESIYKCTITEDFLTVWAAYFFGIYNVDKYPDHMLHECAVYVPSYKTVDRPIDLRISTMTAAADASVTNHAKQYTDSRFTIISLEARAMTSFYLDKPSNWLRPNTALYKFFNNFNMKDRTIDEFIALVASFKLLNDNNMNQNKSMVQVCYELVTRSDKSKSKISTMDETDFFEILREMVTSNRLKTLQNLQLFEELLLQLGKPDISRFFSANQTVTSKSASLFRASIFNDFIPNRFIINMEADNSDMDTALDEDESLENNDLALDGDADDEINPSTEDKEPQQIDPMKMLLEINNKSDGLSDYLFRDIVYKRLTAVINNPPLNLALNDLMLIKQWRTYWLFLVSIQCLKDFLMRIGRISD